MTAGDMLLSVEDLVVRFRTHEGTIHAVNGVSFQLEEGERLGLVGESGCGRSRIIARLVTDLPQPDSPTSPKRSPSSSWKLTPLTAWIVPSWVRNRTTRSSTDRSTSPAVIGASEDPATRASRHRAD